MTCLPADRQFRLLDALVGWDAESHPGIAGLDQISGLHLAETAGGGVDLGEVAGYIPPARLTRLCGTCEWLLLTPAPPQSRLLRFGPCDECWRSGWPCGMPPIVLEDGAAIAAARDRIALTDQGAGMLWVLSRDGAHVLGETHWPGIRALAFGPDCTLVAAVGQGAAIQLMRFDLAGVPLGPIGADLPPGRVDRMAFDSDCRLWLVIILDGRAGLWRLNAENVALPASFADLKDAFLPNGLLRTGLAGFCFAPARPDEPECCYSWRGRILPPGKVSAHARATYETQGQLLTDPLDSGEPRTRWHRVRLDADIPPGTSVELAVSVNESATPVAQGVATGAWAAFPAGFPHPDDWQVVAPGAADALIRQPEGRYLFLRLRLTGDGSSTPVVRRIHLDFPRATSANLLPAVYRDDVAGGDFTEHFVALFDSVLDEVDDATAQFPALLDSDATPDEALPWLAGFLGLSLSADMTPTQSRDLIRAAADLFRRRGTPGGMAELIRLVHGAEPAIEEVGVGARWGALGRVGSACDKTIARLGSVHLFSRSNARVTVGKSTLGAARLQVFGSPDDDPHRAGAFRFRVSMPVATVADADALARLVNSTKPAHTAADIRVGDGVGALFAPALQLGVTTLLSTPPKLTLGGRNARLGRGAVLGGYRRPRGGFAVGFGQLGTD